MRKVLLALALFFSLMAGINPADYDPFHDHPRDTYHLLAASLPLPQEQGWANPNRAGREFTTPPKGANADACKEVWDKGVPCKVDGKFYGYFGELQPDFCDNNYFLPDGRNLKPDAEKCHCNIAMTDGAHCPMDDDGTVQRLSIDGGTCLVYCREKGTEAQSGGQSHCHCVLQCDSATDEEMEKINERGKKK